MYVYVNLRNELVRKRRKKGKEGRSVKFEIE